MKKFFTAFVLSFLFASNSFAEIETAETIYAKAYGALYKNNIKEATKLFERGQEFYPDCAFLYAGMGDIYLKEGNFDKALDYYTIAQRKKYALDVYKIDFYNAYLQKNMEEISNGLNQLISATKNSDNPILYKNIKYIMNENYEKTKLVTELYLNTQDEDLNKVNNYKIAGKKETALRGYLKLLNQNPQNFQAANNAGVTLFELKDYQLAEKYLKQGLEHNPNSPIILNNLAIVDLYQKEYKEMENNFAAALKAKSDYLPAINNKAIAYIHKGLEFYQPENIDSILDIIKKNNEDYFATRTLAKIYFIKGDFKSSFNILKPLNSTYNFKLYTQKAYSAYKANNTEEALNLINKAISLYSDNSIIKALQDNLLVEVNIII